VIGQALNALWSYREMRRNGKEDRAPNAHGRLLQVLERIGGKATEEKWSKPKPAFARAKFKELHDCLLALSPLEPARRVYDFEKFLTRLFNVLLPIVSLICPLDPAAPLQGLLLDRSHRTELKQRFRPLGLRA
jgi:hypothetical protein